MKYSNLDIYATQDKLYELEYALSNIKKPGNLILYTNVYNTIIIGGKRITTRQYDTILFSEENDFIFFVARDGLITADVIREYLNKKNIKYNEVIFSPDINDFRDDRSVPEIWFARELTVLKEAIDDCEKNSETRSCNYYPFEESIFELSYLSNNDGSKQTFEGRKLFGLIQFEDKILLLVSQNDKRNLSPSDVINYLKERNWQCNVIINETLDLTKKSRKQIK